MLQQLEQAERVRREIVVPISQKRKAEFGQFMTPSSVASFMVNLFPPSNLNKCYLLDAGAGVGALSCAFLDHWLTDGFGFQSVEVTAYEIDDHLRNHLAQHLGAYNGVIPHIVAGDYIELATSQGLLCQGYTHVILNPPYKKINSHSTHRQALRRVGIETVNLYSAFLALSLAQTAHGGQLVAILPRSFCNGTYYRSFREFILKHSAIKHIHLFKSRNKTFKDDNVLQENIIIRLEKGGRQEDVKVSTSTDDTFTDMDENIYSFDRIISSDQRQFFIHVPTSTNKNVIEASATFSYTLDDLNIQVSTGPVVDFRVKEYLCDKPGSNTVPLLYPCHFSDKIIWPMGGIKKPNAIEYNASTEKWLYPIGFYCVVRRFSSKEEKRRLVANVVIPDVFGQALMLGFENHLNLFHENKKGLTPELAYGLSVFLNMSVVDEYFRCFNGHTQVNATDLRLMRYPSRDILINLGKWAMQQQKLTQTLIDSQLETLI